MTRPFFTALLLSCATFTMTGCATVAEVLAEAVLDNTSETVDMTEDFANMPEIDRLRWFKEINAGPALKTSGLTGKNVHVTIMGEMVDASHPDLSGNVKRQYNAYSQKGRMVAGAGNQPLGANKFQANDGHGTHIAGTIAAACDGQGVQGLACNASLEVYDLGAYDDADRVSITGWGDTNEFGRFLSAFAYALDDVTARGHSRITTGSFNLESPAIEYSSGSLTGLTVTEILKRTEDKVSSVKDLVEGGYAIPKDPADETYLEQMVERNDDDPFVALGSVLPLSQEWAQLENSVADYQKAGGAYLVTESNYDFDGRTSTLNALPTLSDKVDPELWLSVVMAAPKDMDNLMKSPDEATFDARLKASDYEAPLNSCGAMARDYCILTPSWNVMSTMTERTAFKGEDIIKLDGRTYQSLDGHSMGAPMVAATLALMEEENIRRGYGYTMKDLVRILKANANRRFASYDSSIHGVGMLDVEAALSGMKR